TRTQKEQWTAGVGLVTGPGALGSANAQIHEIQHVMTAGGRLGKWLPGAALLRRYERAQFRHDALAALVVALVTIPSAFAYADLAKCAPAAGLYAAVAGMVVFGLFTSSRHVIVGPDAAIALLVGAAIGPIAAGDVGKAAALAAVLAF